MRVNITLEQKNLVNAYTLLQKTNDTQPSSIKKILTKIA